MVMGYKNVQAKGINFAFVYKGKRVFGRPKGFSMDFDIEYVYLTVKW